MAMRRPLFPGAMVSQTASYCLTAELCCRAQTLSPTTANPSPLSLFQAAGSQNYYFLSERLNEAAKRKETVGRSREGAEDREERHSKRQSEAGEGKLWFI